MIDHGKLDRLDIALIKAKEVHGTTLCKAWLQILWAVVTQSEDHQQMLAWSNLITLWRDAEFQTFLIFREFAMDALCRRARPLSQTSGDTSTCKSSNKQKLNEVACSHIDLPPGPQ